MSSPQARVFWTTRTRPGARLLDDDNGVESTFRESAAVVVLGRAGSVGGVVLRAVSSSSRSSTFERTESFVAYHQRLGHGAVGVELGFDDGRVQDQLGRQRGGRGQRHLGDRSVGVVAGDGHRARERSRSCAGERDPPLHVGGPAAVPRRWNRVGRAGSTVSEPTRSGAVPTLYTRSIREAGMPTNERPKSSSVSDTNASGAAVTRSLAWIGIEDRSGSFVATSMVARCSPPRTPVAVETDVDGLRVAAPDRARGPAHHQPRWLPGSDRDVVDVPTFFFDAVAAIPAGVEADRDAIAGERRQVEGRAREAPASTFVSVRRSPRERVATDVVEDVGVAVDRVHRLPGGTVVQGDLDHAAVGVDRGIVAVVEPVPMLE